MAPLYGFTADETVVVTGAGSGIGLAIATLAAANGLAVALWEREEEGLARAEKAVAEQGARAHPQLVDVTDGPAVTAALEATTAALGRVRYLVNNAGPSSFAPVDFNGGLVGGAGSVALVTETWLAAGPAAGDAVVSISSVAGTLNGVSGQAWYPATKAAIAGYTKFLAVDRKGVPRANAVAPGVTATPRLVDFIQGEGAAVIARNPMGRAADPSEIAAVVCFLLSPAASYVNGVVVPVDGGSTLVM